MIHFMVSWAASLSRACSNRPIHAIVILSLLASAAYLTLVEEYLSTPILQSSETSFFHAAGNAHWDVVDKATGEKDADQFIVTPLRFIADKKSSQPIVPGAFQDANQQYVLSQDIPDSFVGQDGTTWNVRHGNRLSRQFEYLKNRVYGMSQLVQGAEAMDIGMIALAYAAMWFTFVRLFLEMKAMGSTFWLAFGSLVSSGFAFLFALFISTEIFNIKVSLKSLTEGVPFLVATIGFRHKVNFTAPILKATRISGNKDVPATIARCIQDQCALPIIKTHFIVIVSFLCCALYAPHLTGLRNFCLLSSVIMGCDLVMTFSFYSAILSLKAQINKVHQKMALEQALEEEGVVIETTQMKGLFKSNTRVVVFKLLMIAVFFGFHLSVLGTSWLYDVGSQDRQTPSIEVALLASHFGLDQSKATVMTMMPARVYMPSHVVLMVEDYVLWCWAQVSKAIADPFISKSLLVLFGISVCINAFLLNITRLHLMQDSSSSSSSQTKPAPVQQAPVAPAAPINGTSSNKREAVAESAPRPLEQLVLLKDNLPELTNTEVAFLVTSGSVPLYALEKKLNDKTRAVAVRRQAIAHLANAPVLNTDKLPFLDYDYERVFGACCENVIGYMPLPVGVAGPMIIDGKPYHIPMATTEGCLVASTMRGCKAINAGGGVSTVLTQDGMTRAPCVSFPTLQRAGAAKIWLDSHEGQTEIKRAFNSTSRFARLQHIKTAMAGCTLFIRFKTITGDAMGMNMISKGVEHALSCMANELGWEDMTIISVSGNYCTDKKPAAINWIEGRGKSVVAEAIIPADKVKSILKSDVDALVELNVTKNLVGSAMAGSVGGFNAHAANLVTAVFLATGQDPAQNVESSNCITLMNKLPSGDLRISVSMPSIEVGTIGGGTILEPQGAMLELLGVRGPHPEEPGANARQLAKIVASAVLAAELSLCSALAAGHLVQSHMAHNRAPKKSEKELKTLKEGSKICISS